jgi:hypothetical protein
MVRRTAGGVFVCVLFVILTGCGGEGGSGDRPTLSSSVSPTRTLPAPSRSPGETDTPTAESTESPTPEPTDTAEPTRNPEPTRTPRPTRTPEPTEPASTEPAPQETQETQETSAPATPEPSPSEDDSASADEDSADEGVPPWVWWLLGGLLLAAAILTWVLLARSRTRRAWRDRLAAAEAEIAWLARELLPQLRATGSREQVAGGWQVSQPRIVGLDDQLTVLESEAPADTDRARVTDLRDAVRDSRTRVERLVADSSRDWALELDATIAVLESALSPQPPV